MVKAESTFTTAMDLREFVIASAGLAAGMARAGSFGEHARDPMVRYREDGLCDIPDARQVSDLELELDGVVQETINSILCGLWCLMNVNPD